MNLGVFLQRDDFFAKDNPHGSDFEFNEEVALVFDDMLIRSVPFYLEQQSLVANLASRFWIEGTKICDLGCSTGKTLLNV